MAGFSGLTLAFMGGSVLSRILIVVGIFGVTIIFDTVTRHFCVALSECERSSKSEPKTAPPLEKS